MSGSSVRQRLQEIGGKLQFWDAQPRALFAAGAVLAMLWFCTWLDLMLRFHRLGRFVSWFALLALAVAGGWWIWQALSRRRTPEAVAARMERTFPQLDSHLINYVQFSAQPTGDALQIAYLSAEIPHWSSLDLSLLRDRKMLFRGGLVTLIAIVLSVVSALWSGPAWGNAMLRILNPLSARVPGTLAQIIEIRPGNGQVLRGQPALLTLVVDGKKGQPVSIEVKPADDKARIVKLGELKGEGRQEFVHRIPAVAVNTGYRFFAGDAESERYTITALPPLALKRLEYRVTPPAYTKQVPTKGDALKRPPVVPQGAQVELSFEANRVLAEAQVVVDGLPVAAKPAADGGLAWSISAVVTSASPWHVVARDTYGFGNEQDVQFQFLPDEPPALNVVAPPGRVVLPSGGVPRIQWEADDDYGLVMVTLERILGEDNQQAQHVALTNWSGKGGPLGDSWAGNSEMVLAAGREPLLFRLVATDNKAPGEPNRTISKTIRFDREGMSETTSTGAAAARESAIARIEQLIEMQKTNLARTVALQAEAAAASGDAWTEAASAQQAIRDFAGRLLVDPAKPLGAQAKVVREIHGTWMEQAVRLLSRIPQEAAEKRGALGGEAVEMESRILRALTQLEGAVSRVEKHQGVTGLLAFLEAMVAGQDETLSATRKAMASQAKIGQPLVDKQDKLSGDVGVFVKMCERDVQALQQSDAEFAKLVGEAGKACADQKIAGTMLKAAEQLEGNAPDQAMPHQVLALAQLKAIQASLNHWRTEEAKEQEQQLQDALAGAKEKLEKIKDLQGKVVDAIRQTIQQKDHSEKETDELEQEIGEIKENVADALLKIASDLHIFPELPVGNDLVADVSQIYEEVKQTPGSESKPATELGLQKEDWILKALEAATERVDDMEMWLMATPDTTKRLTENFDKQEQPEIPVIPMASEMEDIIGDLLKQEEDIKDQADDSATNQGTSDFAAGWGIADGEFVNYSAKGKSGNEAPDHKEQDGRSLVGRQGMSDGETAAGSGKINAGDDNIEARRTQDSAQSGEVQEEGHAEAKATGGGKQSGYSEQVGMAGTGPRRDTKAGEGAGSMAGMQAMLRRNAEALYAKASMLHIRTGSLDEAVEHMRMAEEALKKGYSIREIREYQRRAIASLKKTQMELAGVTSTESIDDGSQAAVQATEVAGASDEAPARYKDLVSEYFKSLSGEGK